MRRNLIKCVAVAAALALLISVAVLITGAKDNPSFTLSSAAGEPGDEVEVSLSLSNNPGITGLSVSVSYSADDLEIVSIDNAGLFEDSISTSKLTNDPVTISWFALDSQNKSDNGTLAVIKFKLKENAKSSDVTLAYDEDNVFDNRFNNVRFDINNSRVIIGSDPSTTNETYVQDEPKTEVATSTPTVKPTQGGLSADSTAFILSSVTGEPGDEVEVSLNLSNNPGITGLSVSVGYSTADLEIVSIDNGGLFEDSISTSKLTNDPVTISWFALDSQNKSDNGTLAYIKFKIKENAKSSDLTLTYDEDNVFDNKFNNVRFDVINGRVGIGDDTEAQPTEKPTQAQPTVKPTEKQTEAPTQSDTTYILGDVNGDGIVDIVDSAFIQRYSTMVNTPYPIGEPIK